MNRILLFVIAFCSCCAAGAQRRPSPFAAFNTDEFWHRVVADSGTSPLRKGDTVVVIASNRRPAPGDLRWMSEERDGGKIRFFVAYSRGGRWQLRPVEGLSAAIALVPAPDKDWVVYTEGMGKIFTADVDRAFRMAGLYGVNVLLLDYPSIRSDYGPLKNYRFAKRSAIAAYADFVPVLDSVKALRTAARLGTGTVTLFFHSMGNKVLRETVLNGRLAEMNDAVWVDNLVLNAPCVAQRRHRRWLDQIRFAKRRYVHYNPEDGTLKWARILSLSRQLGDRPRRPLSSGVTYVNFNTLCGEGHSNFLNLWGRYMTRPEAVAHYRSLFHGHAPDTTGSGYQRSKYRGIGVDILPAVRR